MTTIINGVRIGTGVLFTNIAPLSVIPSGLVLNLQTAPTSGTTWNNQTGGINTNIMGGAANVSYVSQYGGGIRINNRNISYFDTNLISNTIGNTFTVSLTVAFDQTQSYWASWYGGEGYTNNQGYIAYQSSSSQLNVGAPAGGAAALIFSTIGANIANVNVWDFTINSTTLTYYLNGVWKGQTSILNPTGLFAGNIYFASRHVNAGTPGANDTASGTYYSMRLYNRVLSNVEVTTNYTTLKAIHGLP